MRGGAGKEGVIDGGDSQVIKVDKWPGGRGRGAGDQDFPRESNLVNVRAEGFSGGDGLFESSIPFHGFCNGPSRGGEIVIDAVGIFHGQIFGHIGDPVLSILVVEGGEREDVPQAIPVMVNGHEELLAQGILHLEDQHPE